MNKIIPILLLVCLCSIQGNAQNSFDLTVELRGLSSDKGLAMIGLYDSSSTWLNTAVKGEKSKIVKGKLTVVFKNVSPGEYAISCFHDENENGKLDTGWFGIPTEDYACSRGAVGRFGPPEWQDAVFVVDGNQSISVKF